MRDFKRILSIVLLLCMTVMYAVGEAPAEDPASVTYLDLGSKKMKLSQIENILDQYPNLEKVDMFATPVGVNGVEELEPIQLENSASETGM